MEAKDIRREIAKELDYYLATPPEEDGTTGFSLREPKGTTRYPWHGTEEEAWADAPDFPEDLNAMHEAENTLSDSEQMEYAEYLVSFLHEDFCDLGGTAEHIFACATFSALQRAEAFLRVKGKWKE